MKSRDGLRSFCSDLSSDLPSPGGGTAAAAAGAMAASLLVMVSGLTRKNKKYESHWEEIRRLEGQLARLRDDLIAFADEDARAYDAVVDAMNRRKEGASRKGDELQKALRTAAEVPLKTVGSCLGVLEGASRIAEIGLRSASSDIGVATLLAHAALKGASMNVSVNLADIDDKAFVERMTRALQDAQGKAELLAMRTTLAVGKHVGP